MTWAMTLKPKPKHPNGSVKPKKAPQVWLNVFDCNVMVHYEFLPQGRTVNEENYLENMRRLHKAFR